MNKFLWILMASLLVLGCQSTQPKDEKWGIVEGLENSNKFIENEGLMTLNEIRPFTLKVFSVLSNEHIILEGINGKAFLINTVPGCKNMFYAKNIGLYTLERKVLQAGKDSVARVGDEYKPCLIKHIFKISQGQYEELNYINMKNRRNTGSGFKSTSDGYL
jgi:hypothetical protein